MPSSLIVVALVVAWLVVLVPMIVRKRQEIARTADSALAARVVRSGGAEEVEEGPMRDVEEIDADQAPLGTDAEPADVEPADVEPFVDALSADQARRYRPGRGGFDPEAAAITAKAKYGFRQRVVLAMIVGAIVTGVLAGIVFPMLWWAHGALDLTLVTYLGYLRRQVRIEEEIRARRLARMSAARRLQSFQRAAAAAEDDVDEGPGRRERVAESLGAPPLPAAHPRAAVVDVDDEDPAFDELEQPDSLPYRRAVGE